MDLKPRELVLCFVLLVFVFDQQKSFVVLFRYSLRYHHFNPEYIHERLRQLGQRFELRILLVQVDVVWQ